jgi:hypothetical protein
MPLMPNHDNPVIRATIERLRGELPPLLTIRQYCHLRNRCQALAYRDLQQHPGLAVKDGRAVRIIRDVALDLIAGLPVWVPEKDRVAEADRPYARSRPRTGPTNGTADAAKPAPAAASVVSKPRERRPKRVTPPNIAGATTG